MAGTPEKDAISGQSTTGHEWDGIRELNTPLPRWWVGLFIITCVFSLIYLYLYPGLGTYQGSLKWTQTGQFEKEVARGNEQTAPIYAAFAGKSTEELLRSMGRNPIVLAQTSIEEGIKAARLAFPRCYFDKRKTVRLVECLKRYRRDIHTKTGEPMAPLHDEYSHGADAFRYLGQAVERMGAREHDYEPPEPPDWRT